MFRIGRLSWLAYVSTQQVQHALIVHWNQQWWNGVDSPQPEPLDAGYGAVAARARDDAWAVGSYNDNGRAAPLISHWNGYGWQAMDLSAVRSQGNALYGVATGAADDAWAVGMSGGSDGTLLLHYASDCSLPTANPTSNDLHLAAPDGSADRLVFQAGEVGFNSYHIANGKLIAATLPEISSHFLSYDIATATLSWVPQMNILDPLIGKDALVWTRYTPTGRPGIIATAIERYDPLTGNVTQLLAGKTATVQAVALFDPNLLAYVEPTMYPARYVGKLYLTSALP